MPGVRIPIVPPERLARGDARLQLLLTWNFADEILAQQAEYRRARRQVHHPDSRA